MALLTHLKDSYDKATSAVNNAVEGDKVDLSHELIAAAAAYKAAQEYEKHVAAKGKPDDHAKAKELLAAFAGAAIDRFAETKGVEVFDKLKAKHEAEKHLHEEIVIKEYNV